METICSKCGGLGSDSINKMEASHAFGGKEITKASLQIIKLYVPYILNFLKSYLGENDGQMTMEYHGLPR